ncbi:ATP-binding protein [Methanobrevibacter sp.]|uniref:ATP-binding protein n=1 Tax=Methanobrevibacter sp. TaxID=66852 RepID=UPI00388CF1F4
MSSISLKPELNELYRLNEHISNIIKKKNNHVDLIVEEIFANIVNYSNATFITVNANFEKQILTLEFIDDGFEFNPLKKENFKAPDTIEDAKIGGIGISLIKELADTLEYQYFNNKNHLKIIKKVE